MRVELELELQRSILGDLHATTKTIDISFLRQADNDGLRSGLSGPLVLHQPSRDLLEVGVIFFAITRQQLAQLLWAIVELLLLEDRVDSRCLPQLLVVSDGGTTAIAVQK